MIRPGLEAARERTAPRTQDLYQVFNALLYLLKTGCQWRQLPHDLLLLPNLVSQRSRLSRIFVGTGFKKIVFTLRSQQDRSALTSFIIVDAQSVKNTDTAQNKESVKYLANNGCFGQPFLIEWSLVADADTRPPIPR